MKHRWWRRLQALAARSKEEAPPSPRKLHARQRAGTHNLSDEQLEVFRETFDLFDEDSRGEINADQLGQILEALGQRLSRAELFHYMRTVDTDGSGAIEFGEFCRMMQEILRLQESMLDVKLAFKIFDVNGDGYINPHELGHLLKNQGYALTQAENEKVFRSMDTDQDGRLTYAEFMRFCTSERCETLIEAFESEGHTGAIFGSMRRR